MANLIKVKRTNTASSVPSLVYGELGWNSADSKFFVGSFAGTSVQVGGSSLVVGVDVQAYDAGLQSLAGIATTGADRLIYATATDVYTTSAFTAFGRSLVDDVDASASRTTLGLVIGTNVQAYDAGLLSIAAATTAADKFLYTTALDVYAVATITTFGRSLVDDSTAAAARTTLEIGKVASTLAGGRLTLLTGVGVPTSDQIGATTLYYTPFDHGMIGLYDGTNWIPREFTQRSLIFGGMTSGKNYDVFIGDTAGTLVIEILAWTSDSVRAVALVAVDGVLCKTGDTTRRYVGTFRATSATTTEDSEAKRFVYNANNKVPRSMLGTLGYVDANTVNSFTFLSTLGATAPLNGGTGNKCEWVNGLTETVFLSGSAFYTGGASSYLVVGIGIDTTTGSSFMVSQNDSIGGNAFQRGNSKSVQVAAGYHYGSLNGASTDVANAATIYRDVERFGSAADPIRTFIAGSITS